jgi:hypothetical protein
VTVWQAAVVFVSVGSADSVRVIVTFEWEKRASQELSGLKRAYKEKA